MARVPPWLAVAGLAWVTASVASSGQSPISPLALRNHPAIAYQTTRPADSVARLDDQSLINGVSQIAPFDVAAKQALLEAPDLATRCELLIQLMQFFGRRDTDDGAVTLQ